MASQYKNHPKNPAAQPFNVAPKKCQSKRNTWWSGNNRSYKKQEQISE